MIRYLSKTNPKALRGTALVRLDFNTKDDWRIRAVLPTVRFLLKFARRIVIMSHRGRPKGWDKKLSLRRDAKNLEKMIGHRVNFIPQLDIRKIKETVLKSPEKSIFVLENIRFLKGELDGDLELAKKLASLGDYYVNDAFAVSHRKNVSIAEIEKFLPSYAGLELERELKFLSHVLEKPKRPLVFILGGGKATDKLGVIKNLKSRVDLFLLGGAPANTILLLRGVDVGGSLIDKDEKDLKSLRTIMNYPNLCLPVDFKRKDGAILDIGKETLRIFQEKIRSARTIFWSGPMGLIEKNPYGKGTLEMARAITKNSKALSIAGGGETVMFLKKYRLDKKFTFISTGGGAMLEFLAGKKLPGIEALTK